MDYRLYPWLNCEVLHADQILGLAGSATWASPFIAIDRSGNKWVVKSRVVGRENTGKALVAEQIVGRLAMAIGVPIPYVRLMHVPTELLSHFKSHPISDSRSSSFEAGICHALQYKEGCVRTSGYAPLQDLYADDDEQCEAAKCRLASVSVLWGWVGTQFDFQLFQAEVPPSWPWCMDNGWSLPGAADWSTWTLQHSAPYPKIRVGGELVEPLPSDMELARSGRLTSTFRKIASIGSDTILGITKLIPSEWCTGYSADGMAEYLELRRTQLMQEYEDLGGATV
jgi:hypothetical protein